VLAATPDESLYNPIGTVHGGVAATMLDSAVACAVQSTLPAGMGLRTVRGYVCVCDRTYVLLGG
jgi:acyl-coenzyme A thioesterase PaaI-like protein